MPGGAGGLAPRLCLNWLVRQLGHNAGTGALSTWTLNSEDLGKSYPQDFEGSGAEVAF